MPVGRDLWRLVRMTFPFFLNRLDCRLVQVGREIPLRFFLCLDVGLE